VIGFWRISDFFVGGGPVIQVWRHDIVLRNRYDFSIHGKIAAPPLVAPALRAPLLVGGCSGQRRDAKPESQLGGST
jgi:hypothetical protein